MVYKDFFLPHYRKRLDESVELPQIQIYEPNWIERELKAAFGNEVPPFLAALFVAIIFIALVKVLILSVPKVLN